MRRVYVRATSGRHTRRRLAWGWISQSLFFVLPWLDWDGRRLLLPILALFVLLMWASARVGRLFCGYLCAHTVYADLLLWIERRIEGERGARMRLDAAPPSLRRHGRKIAKHGAWLLLSLANGFTMVAWFMPVRALPALLWHGAPAPWAGLLAYAALTYMNGGLLRHRVCRHFCPLGPMQNALIGGRTLVVSYDHQRGEPRGLRNAKRGAAVLAQGACLDCTLCIQVCPSGSDIRNGLRSDCIGCGACIDACDRVMRQRGEAEGLIRYAPRIKVR
ncbi:4Fe-4S binding protein [Pseudoduganella sp. FT25W]|uniref:4Fe-4S binding protein n=1 Tax=Duganella alba TaxID=2666081 RepID=A0A6L5QL77_9BURK|nr:4Fe-4S dicluster domain-containing protein [Duganella alba]MRX10556.1 4Fe-4S binding protein [Duganella alba]MRX18176.1 4Fe-4S binding protein [Duganella alba]